MKFLLQRRSIIILSLISCLVGSGFNLNAQTPNRPRPSSIVEYEFKNFSTSTSGDYLLAPFSFATINKPKPSLMILDNDGYLKWYMTREDGVLGNFNYFPNENKYTFNHRQSLVPGVPGHFIVLDDNLNLDDSITTTAGIDPDFHENKLLPNGNWLISGKTDSIVDLSAHNFAGTQGSATTSIRAYLIQEFDQNKNLVFQWNSNDFIDPTECYYAHYGYDANDYDYCHGNAIEKDTDGNYLISFRHLNSVYKVSATDGHIIWRLGGKSSDFTFVNDPGFSGQHDIRRLPNGNYTIYDNGNMSGPPKKSRGVEYTLDTVNWTATKVWEFDYSPSFFALAMGNHQTTASDLHFINYGFNRNTSLNTILVDHSNTILSEIHLIDSAQIYRAYYQEQSINLPQFNVQCFDSAGTHYLSAPNGYSNYLWSNDATGQVIPITAIGDYQVYVDYGDGMLASLPFHVSDLSDPCNTNSIWETTRDRSEEIEAYFDLSGRQINRPEPNQIYIVRYKSGRVEKRFFID